MSKLLSVIERNMRGEDKSLQLDLSPKLPLVYGSSYWAVTGMPGTGKTSLADQLFVLDLFDKGLNIRWVYRSMERNTLYKIAKWISYLIYTKEGIIMDFHTLLQNRKKRKQHSNEDLKMIKHYDNVVKNDILSKMNLVGGAATAKEVEAGIRKAHAKQDFDLLIHVTDHVGKVRGSDPFKTLSDYSNMIGHLRDTLGIVAVDIVQLHQKRVSDVHRRKAFGAEMNTSDLYGGEILAQNCDIMLGLLHPYNLGMDNYQGYDLTKLILEDGGDNRYRDLKVMKNNFDRLTRVPSFFVGEAGKFIELPPALELDYEKLVRKYTY